jgi:hypothetical protein
VPLLPLVLALLAQEPAARWAFDGSAEDVRGRADYRESAVSGKALHFNGVDTFVEARPAESPSFTFCAWVYFSDPAAQPVASRDWVLETGADGSLRYAVGGKSVQTPPRTIFPGQWTHLAVAVADGKARILVNGETAAEGEAGIAAAGSPLLLGRHEKRLLRGLMDEARLYDRAIATDSLVAAQLDWYRPKRREAFAGKFALAEGDVLALVGGANLAAENETGFLETSLLLGSTPVHVRNLAWEGDTVFEQRRDLNFGPWKRYLERAGANVVFVQFGQMESFRGEAGLPAFRDAYARLLGEISERTKRVVVLSPTPFTAAEAPLPDLSLRNGDLRKYADACRELAAARGFLFVDLMGAPLPTRNGVHLSEPGLEAAARAVAEALGLPKVDLTATPAARLREAVREKNRLWFDHWRPMNWAFLEGDRTEQPSSRDHGDRKVRWFPVEMQDFLPLLRRQEERIGALLKEARR